MNRPRISKSRGGKRPGAGRPKGSGKFLEATKSVRIPLRLLPAIDEMLSLCALSKRGTVFPLEEKNQAPPVPLFSGRVQAGFPTASDDHIEDTLNLHDYVVRHREATFFVKVQGNSMCGAHIHEGDILVVDRAQGPKEGDIVIALVDGDLTVKRLFRHKDGTISLQAENPSYPPLLLREGQEMSVFGVVTFVLHKV